MNCTNSIHQIALKLLQKVLNNALSGGINDIDALTSDVLEYCKDSSLEMIQAILEDVNLEIRDDKEGRKKVGLVMKEKDRKREILTVLGRLEWSRDYYFDKKKECYLAPLDSIIGVRKRERISDSICAALINNAAGVSYAKSADIVTGGKVSKQTVRNQILKLEISEYTPKEEGKRVSELHVYADEDHVHMQKPGKQRGKENRIVPLVTVTEGTKQVGIRRNATINPVHFVDESMNTKMLWKSVEGYIAKAYDIESIERICLHSDGGRWIQNGLENFAQTKYVIDGYHLGKALNKFARKFPRRKVRPAIKYAIRENAVEKAAKYLKELKKDGVLEEIEAVEEFETYLLNNWSKIREREKGGYPGSCTEGQVSHVLSERFSRNPLGWSKEGLGKLSKIRVHILNGEDITAKDFKRKKREEKYFEYADRIMNEYKECKLDWSIFEKEQEIYDISSATQILVRGYGELRNTFAS